MYRIVAYYNSKRHSHVAFPKRSIPVQVGVGSPSYAYILAGKSHCRSFDQFISVVCSFGGKTGGNESFRGVPFRCRILSANVQNSHQNHKSITVENSTSRGGLLMGSHYYGNRRDEILQSVKQSIADGWSISVSVQRSGISIGTAYAWAKRFNEWKQLFDENRERQLAKPRLGACRG